MDNNRKLAQELLKADGIDPGSATESERIAFVKMLDQQSKSKPSKPVFRPDIWSRIMKSHITKSAAAMIILGFMLFGGISFWPKPEGQTGQWWLGPSTAWAGEILESFDSIQTLVYRKQYVFVGQFGGSHVSGNWNRVYQAPDRTRTELYYESTDEDTFGDNNPHSRMESVTWNISENSDLHHVQVYYDLNCYDTRLFENGGFNKDPVDSLRFYVNLLDRADRILESKTFEGIECVGFEISADKYGDNPEEWIDRIWLDMETKLPVRIEKHGRPISGRPAETMTYIEDQFEYYTEIPVSYFEPVIPEGFIQGKSYEIQAAREREEKGPMVYAEVPVGIKDKIAQAFDTVLNVSYREHSVSQQDDSSDYHRNIILTKNMWCVDYYSCNYLVRSEWFQPSLCNTGAKSFDFNMETYELIQTVVDHLGQTYKITSHPRQSHPDNPMDRIIFLSTMIDKADRFFEDDIVDGIECFGFELSAKKYGTNPDTMKHFIWFDKQDYLPVRMELHWQQDDRPRQLIRDNFEWNAEIDESVFQPQIPEHYKKSE